ncbi:MAG: glycosyltransferase, partial [Acidobacteriota bacterium]
AIAQRGGRLAEGDTSDDAIRFRHRGVAVEAVVDDGSVPRRAEAHARALAPDWVLVSSEDPGQRLLEIAHAAAPGRVVFLAHTTLHLPCGPAAFLRSARAAARLRRCAGILTVSDALADYLRAHLPAADDDGGTELPALGVMRLPVYGDGPWPASGAFENPWITLINPCSFKGLPIFLGLADAFPEARFAAVPTWGANAADRAALAARANVEVLPPFDDVDALYGRTRVMLMPSLWHEAFGQVAVEAMLRGVPVLASDVGGLPEATLGVDGASLPVRPIARYREQLDDRRLPVAEVPAQDLGPWRAALARLIDDRDHWQQRSQIGRAAALDFVRGLDIAPVARFLQTLRPRAVAAADAQRAAPSGDGPAADDPRLAKLSPEKRALLLRRLRQKQRGGG